MKLMTYLLAVFFEKANKFSVPGRVCSSLNGMEPFVRMFFLVFSVSVESENSMPAAKILAWVVEHKKGEHDERY